MDWPTGEAVIEKMGAEHPEVILAFSAGKDSLGAWLAMRGYFSRILPVYYYGIPGLEFIERGIRYRPALRRPGMIEHGRRGWKRPRLSGGFPNGTVRHLRDGTEAARAAVLRLQGQAGP